MFVGRRSASTGALSWTVPAIPKPIATTTAVNITVATIEGGEYPEWRQACAATASHEIRETGTPVLPQGLGRTGLAPAHDQNLLLLVGTGAPVS